MIKTYEIDLDDALVDSASSIFETLGTDIDSAIKLFLTQATLKKGFPFAVVIPEENDDAHSENEEESSPAESEENAPLAEDEPIITEAAEPQSESNTPHETESDELHSGITEEEENALATVDGASAPPVSVSPEVAARVAANEALVAEMRNEIGDKAVTPEFDENEDDGTHGNYEAMPVASETEPAPAPENTASDEDEDETTPDNLFDAWDVGEEEDIGCR